MIKALIISVSLVSSLPAMSQGYNLTHEEIMDLVKPTPDHEREVNGVLPNPNSGIGDVCFSDGGKGSFIPSTMRNEDFQIEAIQCKTKDQLIKILGGVGLGLKTGSYVCKLFPHPYAQVSAIVMDGSANIFAWLTFGAGVLDCEDNTETELLLSACAKLQRQGINCRAVDPKNENK